MPTSSKRWPGGHHRGPPSRRPAPRLRMAVGSDSGGQDPRCRGARRGAGPPILNHLDGAKLEGVCMVVTRYFGGTKLGVGGLIRAYGGAAGEAIRAAEIVEVRATSEVLVDLSYSEQGSGCSRLWPRASKSDPACLRQHRRPSGGSRGGQSGSH